MEMNKHLIIIGVAVLLLAVGLSGCVQETPTSKGNVSFKIEEVTVTSELEIEQYFTNETKIEKSNDTKFIIISITIDNKEDKWLTVQTSFQSLTDDEGNKYDAEMFVKINGSTYTVEQISSINEDEALDWSSDVAPNSTEIKKAVYELPMDREPDRLEISYGFSPNELANVEKWYHTYLNIPPSIT